MTRSLLFAVVVIVAGAVLAQPAPLAAPPVAPGASCNEAAQCLKVCAGDPKNAQGAKLMQCLQQCEARCAPKGLADAGVK